MIAYFLTGDPPLTERRFVGLADYILNCEDPAKTVFRWLSREYTGLATDSQAGYPRPRPRLGELGERPPRRLPPHGRSQVSGVRRTTDPPRGQPDSEPRCARSAQTRSCAGFYTMFLQALGRYPRHPKSSEGNSTACTPTGRATLLHYARWMAERGTTDFWIRPRSYSTPTENVGGAGSAQGRSVPVRGEAREWRGARALPRTGPRGFSKTSVAKLDTFSDEVALPAGRADDELRLEPQLVGGRAKPSVSPEPTETDGSHRRLDDVRPAEGEGDEARQATGGSPGRWARLLS